MPGLIVKIYCWNDSLIVSINFYFSAQIQGRLRNFITVKQKRAIDIIRSVFAPLGNFSFHHKIAGVIQVYLITTTKQTNVMRSARQAHVQIMVMSSQAVAMISKLRVNVRLDML